MPSPATARIWPVLGCIATTPPSCPPSAVTAARCTAGEIVVRTAGAAFGTAVASTRVAAPERARGQQFAARRAAQAVVQRLLDAAHADDRVRGDAFGFQLRCACGRDGSDFAQHRAGGGAERRGALPGFGGRAFAQHRTVACQAPSRGAAGSSCG